MSSVLGADPDQMDDLARFLDAEASRMAGLSGQIDGGLRSVFWHGPTAESFRVDWARRIGPGLRHVVDDLGQQAVLLRRNAAEQRRVSSGNSLTGLAAVPSFSGGLFAEYAVKAMSEPGFELGQWLASLPDGTFDSVGNLLDGIDSLVGAVGLDTVLGEFSKLEAFSIATAGASLGLSAIANALPEGAAKQVAEGSGLLVRLGSQVGVLKLAEHGAKFGTVGPALGVAGGVFTMGGGFMKLLDAKSGQAKAAAGLQIGGGALTTAGSVAMLIPGGQVVGAGLLVAGAGMQLTSWVVDNYYDEMAAALDVSVGAVMDGAEVVGDAIEDGVEAVGEVVDAVGDTIGEAASQAWNKLGGLF